MRIAIIASPWLPVPPVSYGGTETVLDALARGLCAAGHEVVLYATGDSTCPVPRRHLFEVAAGTGLDPAIEIEHVRAAYADERVRSADVVHDHTIVGLEEAMRHPDLTVLHTNHGPFGGESLAVHRRVAHRVAIIAISHDQARHAHGVPVEAVIHHGTDVGAIAPGDGGDHALFLGRMDPTKGVADACKVATRAGVPLRIAAKMREPNEVAYFSEEVEPLLGDGIHYVGEVDHDAKLELLRGARCLLNPIAWSEPFGMVMIEALACGTPVVASAIGSVPELVDEGLTGFVCANDDALVSGVRNATQLDRRLCRKTAESRFSTERMVQDHIAVYERVRARRLHERAP